MNEELKPCPVCGRSDVHYYLIVDQVKCKYCLEVQSYEEWQMETAREIILKKEIAKVEKERDFLKYKLNMFITPRREKL